MAQPHGTATFRAPAEAYDRYIGRYGPPLAAALCDAAGVRAGDCVLDVGCGPGALAGELVRRLGAARVAAVDPSPPFAAACRERLPGVRVEEAPAERLPFADAAFDRVLSQLVLTFLTDARAGVAEMVRVTRPGGTVGAAVWDYTDKMVLLRRFWDAAVALDAAARELDEGVSMRPCTPGELLELWARSGLANAAVTGVVVRAAYTGFDDLWAPLEAGVGPAGAYAAALDAERRAALRDEVRRRLGVGEGPFELAARAWVVTGRVA